MSTWANEFEVALAEDISAAMTVQAFHSLWDVIEASELAPDKKEIFKAQLIERMAYRRKAAPADFNRELIPCAA